ncbi:OmpA family protein [Parapedobacter indicus]|uniref:Outer membrane protein OmpA n=1 Tax=Parapedobacter indicus TaxID=1477437 RepID=A0A1I3LRL1_9SPHI|nr:OmpA family protein [Parapedobacter indicus]PPL01402.1 outer membrane protein OmpA-like peptidoglycan-associated protein [Parapedobacter indicus]SFI87371.1 Outer membrane protein OmpA [Parapedobacter indicus]
MITNRKIALFGLSVATSAMLLGSCSTIQSMSNTQKGAATGAVAGGALGAIIGKKAGNTAVGVLAGAALGGVAGGLIGKKMDKQAAEIERTVAGAEVIKADEGIIVKFDSGILFDFDKTDLKPDAKTNIAKLVENLNDNPNTDILVIGHTDNKGTDTYNQGLSERRAKSVKSYAVSQGLAGRRVKTEGKSFHEPIADNSTEAGRAENRRVEIVIVANDKMKKEAEEEAGV